jgi:hypothetical protein
MYYSNPMQVISTRYIFMYTHEYIDSLSIVDPGYII